MTSRTWICLAVALLVVIPLAGCSQDGTPPPPPTGPTPPPPSPGPEQNIAVSGWVADSAARLISGARVEVMTGAQAGTVVFSDDRGQFSFETPLGATTRLRASKAGYIDDIRALATNAATGSVRIDFELRSPNPPVDLTGHYRITFSADSACANLPAAAQSRTYLANITSKADLYGAKFGGSDDGSYLWRTLYLGQFEDYARFFVQDPPVWELLPNDDWVVIFGDAEGTVGPGSSTLTFSGWFSYCPRLGPGQGPVCAVEEIVCSSSRHQMSMTRR